MPGGPLIEQLTGQPLIGVGPYTSGGSGFGNPASAVGSGSGGALSNTRARSASQNSPIPGANNTSPPKDPIFSKFFAKNWRDNLSNASFRGASFKIFSSETQIGRNVKTTPKITPNAQLQAVLGRRTVSNMTNSGFGIRRMMTRNIQGVERIPATVQDQGRAPQKFTLTGYVIQTSENNYDYFGERDLLMYVLQQYGPGRLVHPYYGELDVLVAEPATVEESFKEGGIAKFKMTFIESCQPQGVNLEQITADWFNRISSLSELCSALGLDSLASIISGVMDAVNAIQAIKGALQAVVNGINQIKGAISSVVAAATGFISDLISTIDQIANSPCNIIGAVKSGAESFLNIGGMTSGELVVGGVTGGCSGIKTSNNDQYILTGTSIPSALGKSIVQSMTSIVTRIPPVAEDSSSENTTVFQTVMNNSVKFFTFNTLIRIAIIIDFTNKEELEDLIALVTDAMDGFLDDLGSQNANVHNDDIFVLMQKIRSEFIICMYGKGENLIHLTTYTTTQNPPPILVLAYKWYEDIYRETEIIQLNDPVIRHPGFPPQGVDIKLLSA